jgi:hypothetical protein
MGQGSLHCYETPSPCFVKEDRTIESACSTSCIRGDDTNLVISQRAIELFGSVTLASIEYEQRKPTFTGSLFNCLHERLPGASTALSLEDKEFLHFGSMQRIRFRGKCKLDRAPCYTEAEEARFLPLALYRP